MYYHKWCYPSNQAGVAFKSLSKITKKFIHVESEPNQVRDLNIIATPTIILEDELGNHIKTLVGFDSEEFNKIFKEYK